MGGCCFTFGFRGNFPHSALVFLYFLDVNRESQASVDRQSTSGYIFYRVWFLFNWKIPIHVLKTAVQYNYVYILYNEILAPKLLTKKYRIDLSQNIYSDLIIELEQLPKCSVLGIKT